MNATGTGMSAERLKRVQQVMDNWVASKSLAGAVTLVARSGKPAFAGVAGYQDLASKAPMKRDAIFALASMTKAVTAVATMMVVEECKISLDEPVERILPELANPRVMLDPEGPLSNTRPAHRPITVRDLLTYRMGLGMIPLAGISPEAPLSQAFMGIDTSKLTPDEYMAQVGALPLAFEPGARYMYHATSEIMGVLVKRVSGMEFDEFCQKRIFEPLGMVDSGFWVPKEKQSRLATVYTPNPQSGDLMTAPLWFASPAARPSFPSGGGGMFSTADDFLKFAQMMLNNGQLDGVRILSRKSIELMTQDHVFAGRAPHEKDFFHVPGYWGGTGFGFGLQIQTAQENIGPSVGSYWWGGATGVWFIADPVEKLAYVFMVQLLGGYPLAVRGDLNTAIYQAIED